MTKLYFLGCYLLLCSISCQEKATHQNSNVEIAKSAVQLMVLGNVQDAGSPHVGCKKSCCAPLDGLEIAQRYVSCLGVIDHSNNSSYLFDATPDIVPQLSMMHEVSNAESDIPTGIFLTHAHIGHYTGLMYLGRESVNAQGVEVYSMSRMQSFLSENGPWSQLVTLGNIQLAELNENKQVTLSQDLSVTPITVPHRDEFSETVGFIIEGPNKSALFIPDIDKWSKWDKNIIEEVKKVDYAFIDATFYDAEEINYRPIEEIPHPFVVETIALFVDQDIEIKNKIHFIHLNHTNPLLDEDSRQSKAVIDGGYNIARTGQIFNL